MRRSNGHRIACGAAKPGSAEGVRIEPEAAQGGSGPSSEEWSEAGLLAGQGICRAACMPGAARRHFPRMAAPGSVTGRATHLHAWRAQSSAWPKRSSFELEGCTCRRGIVGKLPFWSPVVRRRDERIVRSMECLSLWEARSTLASRCQEHRSRVIKGRRTVRVWSLQRPWEGKWTER
jgi:hypothetical protein